MNQVNSLIVVMFCVAGLPQSIFAPIIRDLRLDLQPGITAPYVELSTPESLTAAASAAYFLVAAPVGATCGAFADNLSRRFIVLTCIAASASAFAIISIAVTDTTFLLARCVQGAAAGALVPAAYSALGDLVAPDDRSSAASFVGMSVGIGAAIGQLGSGMVLRDLGIGQAKMHGAAITVMNGGWRHLSLVVAVVIGALFVWLYLSWHEPVREKASAPSLPVRVAQSNRPGEEVPRNTSDALLTRFIRVGSIPTARTILGQGLVGTIPWTCISIFLPGFLNDVVNQNYALPKHMAMALMLTFGIGGLVGGAVGGQVGKIWSMKSTNGSGRALLPMIIGGCQASGGVPMAILFYLYCARASKFDSAEAALPSSSIDAYVLAMAVAAFTAGILSSIAGPNLRAMLLNCTPPDARASAFALGSLIDAGMKGVSPIAVGRALATCIDYRQRAAVLASIMTAGWLISGLLIASAAFSIQQDEQTATLSGLARSRGEEQGACSSSPRDSDSGGAARRRKFDSE